MDRRNYLRYSIAAAGVWLAGCAGDDTGETETTDPGRSTGSVTGTGDRTTATEPATTTAGSGGPTTTATTTEPTATTEPTTTTTATEPTATTEPTTTTPPPAQVVEVGVDQRFRFGPESFTIAAGETVRWVWVFGGHNVVPQSTPDGADWRGTPDPPNRTFDAGYVYEHTFRAPGEYQYYCTPHRAAGMVGSFTVEE